MAGSLCHAGYLVPAVVNRLHAWCYWRSGDSLIVSRFRLCGSLREEVVRALGGGVIGQHA
jgi:hypothetical protein